MENGACVFGSCFLQQHVLLWDDAGDVRIAFRFYVKPRRCSGAGRQSRSSYVGRGVTFVRKRLCLNCFALILGFWGLAGCVHLGLLPISQVPFEAAILLYAVAASLVRTVLRPEVHPVSKGEGYQKRRVSRAGKERRRGETKSVSTEGGPW